MDLTRFSRDMDGSMEPDESGAWVRFEDVNAAQADARYRLIGQALERGAKELPEGWWLEVHIELDAGVVHLYNPEGDEVELTEEHEGLDDEINQAIAKAKELAK